jgi:hypothetical protein
VKRSGRDELIQVVIHKCMEATLGISLHSYLYLNWQNTVSFLLSLIFSLQQNQITPARNGFGEEVQIMYTHVSKCKNDKRKKK